MSKSKHSSIANSTCFFTFIVASMPITGLHSAGQHVEAKKKNKPKVWLGPHLSLSCGLAPISVPDTKFTADIASLQRWLDVI